MDYSKLPKLSNTPSPPEGPPESPEQRDFRADAGSPAPVSIGGEAFLSIAFGAIFLLMYRRVLAWMLGRGVGTFTNETGQTITYAQSVFLWLDLGPALFGVALILDGICLIICRPWALWLGMLVTSLSVAVNLWVSVWLLNYGPYISMLCAAFGVYAAIYQWKLLRVLRTGRPAPMT